MGSGCWLVGMTFQSTPSRRGRHFERGRNSCPYCFNPLPHAEGDGLASFCIIWILCFNPLPHAEGDTVEECREAREKRFNPLPHAEGDIEDRLIRENVAQFQSTPSRRGRPFYHLFNHPSNLFQSTPSRRGRRYGYEVIQTGVCVSIHSLTQRETALYSAIIFLQSVSIHSLTQRETLAPSVILPTLSSFNPLPHAEGDACSFLSTKQIVLFQSTPSRRGRHRGQADP